MKWVSDSFEPFLSRDEFISAFEAVDSRARARFLESVGLGVFVNQELELGRVAELLRRFSYVCTRICQSPIEQQFLAAVVDATLSPKCFPHIAIDPGDDLPDEPTFAILPQWPVAGFAVDFVLAVCNIHFPVRLAVECDGHQFHEKTKEQVSRDKRRDRKIQGAGVPIYRFSGSDVYRDAFACAAECVDSLIMLSDEKYGATRAVAPT